VRLLDRLWERVARALLPDPCLLPPRALLTQVLPWAAPTCLTCGAQVGTNFTIIGRVWDVRTLGWECGHCGVRFFRYPAEGSDEGEATWST
jgi:DNA-directed RNA polymerase subunit RPC12/RpoP